MKLLSLLFTLSLLVLSQTATAGWDRQRSTIVETAMQVGVNPFYQAAVAHVESRFKVVSKATSSKAAGLFQFTPGTWKEQLKRSGKHYGLSLSITRFNARANALMAAAHTQDNSTYLRRLLKRDPVPGELYSAHLLGKGGARKLLTANNNANAAALLPTAAKNNRPMFYTSKGKPRTVRQMRDFLNWKIVSLMEHYQGDIEEYQEEMMARDQPPVIFTDDITSLIVKL